MQTPLSILGVPSSAGAHFAGQERAPRHFRAAGLLDALRAEGVAPRDLGDLPETVFRPDPAQRSRQSLPRVAGVAREVADRAADAWAPGAPLLVLGGDCTIELGVVAGLARRVERLGLLYFDANIDLNVPAHSASGIQDSMGVSHLIGLLDDELSRIGPRFPLLPDAQIALFGYHPAGLNPDEPERLRSRGMPAWPLEAALARPDAAGEAIEQLEARAERILVHFDVDFIDFAAYPVANIPHYHPGATFELAMEWLARFVASPKFAGLTITEFNPDRDPDGAYARRLVAGVAGALGAGSRHWAG